MIDTNIYKPNDRVMLLYDKNYIMGLAKSGDVGTIISIYPNSIGQFGHCLVDFPNKIYHVCICERDLIRI